MADIYDQHAKSFANVEAHVVLLDGERFATVAFKYPKDGAGRLYAYVHVFSFQMVRGSATGYGYDKRTAACSSAMQQAVNLRDTGGDYERFWHALEADRGPRWDDSLRAAGFAVLQAV